MINYGIRIRAWICTFMLFTEMISGSINAQNNSNIIIPESRFYPALHGYSNIPADSFAVIHSFEATPFITLGEYKALFWIYMPQFNKLLASVKMLQSGLPDDIQTLEDVFFHRYFNASWVFSNSPYDRTLEEKLQLIDDNARSTDKFIIGQIETEHDFWVKFFGTE